MRVSFRCFFKGTKNYTQHYQNIHIRDIHLWMMAYKFTHPNCVSMTIQVKFDEEGGADRVSGDGETQHDRETENDLQL